MDTVMQLDTPEIEVQEYGVYSAQAVRAGFGSWIYSTPDGGEVEVTCVYVNPQFLKHRYNWPDKTEPFKVSGFLRKEAEARSLTNES